MEQLMLDLTGVKSEKRFLMPAEEISETIRKKTRLGKCGCPFWKYNFETRQTECRLTGEPSPDEGAGNLFRCDFDYEKCESFVRALEISK